MGSLTPKLLKYMKVLNRNSEQEEENTELSGRLSRFHHNIMEPFFTNQDNNEDDFLPHLLHDEGEEDIDFLTVHYKHLIDLKIFFYPSTGCRHLYSGRKI